ncbi:MAG: dockerin type I repeat-containing protein, partial [Clostridia bacterium]|nr:dockerin type I repeat-containing protein [Clostridia bacterium]
MKRVLSFLLVFSFFMQIFPLYTFTIGLDAIETEDNLMQLNTGEVIENDVSLMQLTIGDLNGDCLVDDTDLTILSKHVAKIKLIEDDSLLNNADINSDGVVNAEDLTELSSYVNTNNSFMIKDISVNISEAVVGSVFEWTVNAEGGNGHMEYFFELNRIRSTESFSLEESFDSDIVVSSESYSAANYFCVTIMDPGEYSINVYCRDEKGNICSAKNVIPVSALSQKLRVIDVTADVCRKVCENTPIVWTVKTEGGKYPLVYTYTLIHNNTEICTYSSDMSSYILDSCSPGEYQLKIECSDSDNNKSSYLSEIIAVYSENVLNLQAPELHVLNKDFFLVETESDAGKFEEQSLLLEWDTVFGADEYGLDLSYRSSGEWINVFSVENLTSCKYTLPQELFHANISEKLFRIGVYSKGITTGDIRYYYFCMSPENVDSSVNVNSGIVSTWDIATSNKVSRYFYVDSALDYS